MRSAEEIKEKLSSAGPPMDVDEKQKPHNKITSLNEDGHYPKWMSQRACNKTKAKV